MKNNRFSPAVLAGMGALTAIVIVLQYLGSFIRFGIFSISLVLIPIVIGAALYGAWAGAWLGFVFGVVVLASGDAAAFLAINIPGTVLTVLLKGTAAGLISGLLFRAVKEKNRLAAVIAAAIACPVVNTGIFLLGCRMFFMDTINEWALGAGFESAGAFMIIGLVGANFLMELLVNVVASPVVLRIISIIRRSVLSNAVSS